MFCDSHTFVTEEKGRGTGVYGHETDPFSHTVERGCVRRCKGPAPDYDSDSDSKESDSFPEL